MARKLLLTILIAGLIVALPFKYPIGFVEKGKVRAVLDLNTSKIVMLNEKGQKVKELDPGLIIPTDITWDGEAFWVCSRMENKIVRIGTDGKILKVISAPAPSMMGIAWDGNRASLWVVNRRKMYRISPADGTEFIAYPAPSPYVTSLDYADGYLWAVDMRKDAIYQIDPETAWVVNIFPYPGPHPTGISVDNFIAKVSDFERGKVLTVDLKKFLRKKIRKYNRKVSKITLVQGVIAGGGIVERAELYFAIPENRSFQKIISVKPLFKPEVLEDAGGQKIYRCVLKNIKPGERKECRVEIKAELFSVDYFMEPDRIKGEIPEEIKAVYLADAEKYQLKDPYIKNLVKQILKGEKRYYWKVQKIFRFMGERLEYELAGGWNPAPVVLKRGTGSCSEYTFSFIALLRAAGIPARYVGSVVERGERGSYDWVFHRWAEVYFPGYGWVPVDAQAGDKTLLADQASYFGHLSNRFLVTTQSPGPSKYLGWTYNFSNKITARSSDYRVYEKAFWEPAEK